MGVTSVDLVWQGALRCFVTFYKKNQYSVCGICSLLLINKHGVSSPQKSEGRAHVIGVLL